METRNYWEENGHAVKYESYNGTEEFNRSTSDVLGFTPPSEDEGEFPPGSYLKKGKVSRQDPISHRIIEKRRRDRMNNCLADLSRLIPPEYLKKGRGRVEKTEIIEMAIRHLKFLQERANAAERQVSEQQFRSGFQEALAETMRFLVEIQGYSPGDVVCVQLATHLQRHCDHITKGDVMVRDKHHSQTNGSSSETASSSSSSHGYMKGGGGMLHQELRRDPEPPSYVEPFEPERGVEPTYPMDCERVGQMSLSELDTGSEFEPQPLDGRRKAEPTLRAVRKPEHPQDYIHSYKFKNSIQRRFSRSQDCEATDMTLRTNHTHGKTYSHKRRRAAKPATSTSTSASGSTEEARDTSPQDTSSESPHNHHYEKPIQPTQFVPIFALNALGKYYVPLSVDYGCLARHLGPYDALDARGVSISAPLHPVTIHVNWAGPCTSYVKREQDRDWRPV